MSYHPPHMKDVRSAAIAALVCVVGTQGASRVLVRAAADTRALTILQSELQRNFQTLKQQPSPAYFISYTLHDQRATRLAASFGAVDRNDESRNRFATVEVRVGDYDLDNTHPIRGDSRAMGPRVTRVALPVTDDEQPIRLALWRATDRTFKQASEALTRVKTNVAAKVKEEDPAPDFSREDPQTYTGDTGQLLARRESLGSAPPADLRALRGRSARVPQQRVAVGRLRQPLLHQQRRHADRHRRCRVPPVHPGGHEGRRRDGAAAVPELLRQLAVRAAGREAADRGRPQHDGPARAPAQGAARRSVLGPGDSLRPRGRRLLPRDLRPPRRGQPPAERRRWADVRQQGRAAGAAGVSERRVRSDAAEARQRRADGPLPVRRRRRARRGG